MDYIKFEYDNIDARYWIENSVYRDSSSGNMIYGLTELVSEVVRAGWTPDFEHFLFDDALESFRSNELLIQKKGDALRVHPFVGHVMSIPKKAFENLFKELKQAFAIQVPLIMVLWDGQKFMVKKHE